jgi:hypothetical protein
MAEASKSEHSKSEIAEQTYDGEMCVVKSIDSMVTQISGKKIQVNKSMHQFRHEQIEQAIASASAAESKINDKYKGFSSLLFYKKRKEMLDIGKNLTKNDDIMGLLSEIQASDAAVGKILKQCDITTTRGEISDAINFAKQGYAVGVSTYLPIPHSCEMQRHFFHLSTGSDGSTYDMSTFSEPYSLKNNLLANYEYYAKKALKDARGWNILLLKLKPV